MKKLYLLIWVTVMLITTSCDDFLATDTPSKQSNTNVFDTEAMAEAAIMGVYATMSDTYVYGQKISVNWQNISDTENCGFSVTNYREVTSDYGQNHYYGNVGNHTTRWNNLFRFAELASAAVEGMREGALLKTNPAVGKQLLGEALVLRALAYFEMTRIYGDIPYKETTSDSDLSNVYIGKIDRDLVYADLIKNLQESIEYLPWLGSGKAANAERISKGFAKGMLARVALFAGGWSLRDGNLFPDLQLEKHPTIPEMNGYYVGRVKNYKDYYEIAAKQCAEILGDVENPHQLDPDYENIWKTVNHLDQNPYKENLYEVGLGVGNTGDVGTLMGWEVSGGSMYGQQGMGSSYVASNIYYFYSFGQKDKRRDVTLTFGRWRKENYEDFGLSVSGVHFAKWRMYWTSETYRAFHLSAVGRVATGINWIVMRYSDIYLMFAEAMNELHGPDQMNTTAGITARQALEKVRERAFGAGSPDIARYDSDFFHAIVNERAWEFGGEGVRKMDLIRWGLLDKKIEAMKEGLCLMLDNQHPVTIFDKTYQPSDFPTVLYYKKRADDNLYVDYSSPNYYNELGSAPIGYEKLDWFPKSYKKPETGTSTTYRDELVKILVAATGLNASYDYSTLLAKMKYGAEVSDILKQYPIGNGICNFRHPFAIYEADIYQSKGYLTNSYGY